MCSCGNIYVGQTGREIQERVSEHKKSWEKKTGAFSSHIEPDHLPDFENVHVLESEKSTEIRELKEAMLILKAGEACIENHTLGQRSAVNRNRGKDLDPHWIEAVKRLDPLPSHTA